MDQGQKPKLNWAKSMKFVTAREAKKKKQWLKRYEQFLDSRYTRYARPTGHLCNHQHIDRSAEPAAFNTAEDKFACRVAANGKYSSVESCRDFS
jgi:hypothetical protein